MDEKNEFLNQPLMRLVSFVNANTLTLVSKLEKKHFGSLQKPFKTVKDLVECDIEELKSLLIYKVGRDYQSILFEIEEGLALAGLKIKNSDFSPYDIRYERLKFPKTIMEKLKKSFPSAKTAGDISILGTKRLVQAGITYHDLSRYINGEMERLNMVIESDKKSVLRHSTYANPIKERKKPEQTRLTTSIERNEEAQKMQRSFERDSRVQVFKPGPDEEIKDGKIVKKVETPVIKKPATETAPTQTKERSQFWQDVRSGKITLGETATATKPEIKQTQTTVQSSETKLSPVSVTPNQAILNMTIEEFGFSKRTIEALHKIEKIKTVGDLANFGKTKLKNSSGIGPGAVLEIETLLFKHGIALKDSLCFKKGVFKSYGKTAVTITAEEIRNMSIQELIAKVSDQRKNGNHKPSKKIKTVKTKSDNITKPTQTVATSEKPAEKPNQAILDMTIEDFGFSKRTIEALHKIDGIKTVGDIAEFGKTKLKNSSGIGPGAVLEIEALLFKHGIALKDSKCFKKGVFKSYGKTAVTITAEEIRNMSIQELIAKVSDQRKNGNHKQTKQVSEQKNQTHETTETVPTVLETEQTDQSILKEKKKRVRKTKLYGEHNPSVESSQPDLAEIEIKNLANALKKYGITALERVNSLSFTENSSDFDEIKIAVNDYFNGRISSTVEVAPSSKAIEKMKEQIFDEMSEYERIVSQKRESLKSSKLEIKRQTASIVLKNSLKSLMNKFYQNMPASGLISGDRVKLHSFTGPLIQQENALEQNQMQF